MPSNSRFKVTLPKNAKAGQTLRIRCDKKVVVSLTVPQDKGPGDSVMFDVQKNGEATIVDPSSTTTSNNAWQDLGLSMGAGLLIGLCLVLGFFAGVLHVTRYHFATISTETVTKPVIRTQPADNTAANTAGHCQPQSCAATTTQSCNAAVQPAEQNQHVLPGTTMPTTTQPKVCNAK